MKSGIKLASLGLAVTLIVSSFIGCSTKDTAKNAATTAGTTTKAAVTETTKAAEVLVPFKETFSFTFMGGMWSPYDPNEMTILNEIQKRTNTKITFNWVPNANLTDKINTTLASNDLPDVLNGGSVPMLIDQGAIVPLDDLLKKYGGAITKLLTPEDYTFMRSVNDGKVYGLPTVFDFPPSFSTMIRKDWLDKVGMKTPVTWDEWVQVWKKFKETDANGDGNPNNQIPYAGDIYQMYPVFGIQWNGNWKAPFCLTDDGQYTLVYEHPNYKSFLENMNKLYKDGLIDKEFATRGTFVNNAEMFKVMDNNTAGSTMTYAERARLSTDTNREKDPKATWLCVPPIKGPTGKQLTLPRAKISGNLTFTIAADKAKKTEKLMQFWNWIMSDEGTKLINWGIEGKHHDIANGKPVLKAPYVTSFVEARKAGLIYQPIPFNWLKDNYMQILLQGKSATEISETVKLFYDGLFLNEPYMYKLAPTLNTKAYQDKQAEVLPKMIELQANAIVGNITIDQFYSEYDKLKKSGISDILKEGAEAWKKVSGK